MTGEMAKKRQMRLRYLTGFLPGFTNLYRPLPAKINNLFSAVVCQKGRARSPLRAVSGCKTNGRLTTLAAGRGLPALPVKSRTLLQLTPDS